MSKAKSFLANNLVAHHEHLAMLITIFLLESLFSMAKEKILAKTARSDKEKSGRLRHNGKQMPLCLSARGVYSPTGFRVQEYEIELM